METPTKARKLKQFVLKPTVYCYHRCPYCDLRQDYYRDMVADRKQALKILPVIAGHGCRTRVTCRLTSRCARSMRRRRWAWRSCSSAAGIRCCTRIWLR